MVLLEDLYRKKQVIFGAIMEVPVRKMYISDLHFGHAILNDAMDCRGFASADEMNEYMIKKWNEKVTDIDEVYILGDFSVIFAKKTNEIHYSYNYFLIPSLTALSNSSLEHGFLITQ